MSDNVEKPSHYNQGSVETIDGIRAALGVGFLAYCLGNVLKYVWRCGLKGDAVEDLRKARKYLEWAIEAMEGNCPVIPDSSTWIPKVGDKVRVLTFGRIASRYECVITESAGGRYTVKHLNLVSKNLEAKELELIEAAS